MLDTDIVLRLLLPRPPPRLVTTQPKVFISDFFPDEEESFVDTDEAEVDVDVYGRSEGGTSAVQIQQLDAGKMAFLKLSSLMVGASTSAIRVSIANLQR